MLLCVSFYLFDKPFVNSNTTVMFVKGRKRTIVIIVNVSFAINCHTNKWKTLAYVKHIVVLRHRFCNNYRFLWAEPVVFMCMAANNYWYKCIY